MPLLALVVGGPPGSGKSTLGLALARQLGAALLDQDVLTTPLTAVVADLLGESDLDAPALASATRSARYQTVVAAAEDNLCAGLPVVMVAPFTAERRSRAAWATLAARLEDAGGLPTLVWLRISADRLARRIGERAAARDAGKLADIDGFLRAVLAAPVVPCLEVDADRPLDEQCALVLRGVS